MTLLVFFFFPDYRTWQQVHQHKYQDKKVIKWGLFENSDKGSLNLLHIVFLAS